MHNITTCVVALKEKIVSVPGSSVVKLLLRRTLQPQQDIEQER